MLRWAAGKTRKDNIKNEDIWREANIDQCNIPHKETTELVRPRVKEGRKGRILPRRC